MQDRPDKTVILTRVARFLEEQVRPSISDKALAYRVRVAAHLLGVVAREVANEEQDDRAQIEALWALLGESEVLPLGPTATRAAITEAHHEVARRIREGELPIEVALPVLIERLAATLRVSNPRFELSLEVEDQSAE